MPMPTLQQIIGTITGKVAFERTQANFTTIKDAHNALETNVNSKAPNADLVAHKADNTSAHGIDTKANKTPPTWINLTLQNGWGSSSLPRYRKNEFGELQLQGRITGGTTTSGTILFTLPEGYRVIGSRTVTTTTYTTSSIKVLLLSFTSNGEVYIHNANTASSTITLENITISL